MLLKDDFDALRFNHINEFHVLIANIEKKYLYL